MRTKNNIYAHLCMDKPKSKVCESLEKHLRGVAQLGSAGAFGAMELTSKNDCRGIDCLIFVNTFSDSYRGVSIQLVLKEH